MLYAIYPQLPQLLKVHVREPVVLRPAPTAVETITTLRGLRIPRFSTGPMRVDRRGLNSPRLLGIPPIIVGLQRTEPAGIR
jgi:hypothetical protein